jgi:hypothetical protein
MPEIREPFVEGINRQLWLAALILSVVTFFLITGCSTVDLGFSSKSSLWELKGKGVTIYLLGSMHLLPEKAYPLRWKWSGHSKTLIVGAGHLVGKNGLVETLRRRPRSYRPYRTVNVFQCSRQLLPGYHHLVPPGQKSGDSHDL